MLFKFLWHIISVQQTCEMTKWVNYYLSVAWDLTFFLASLIIFQNLFNNEIISLVYVRSFSKLMCAFLICSVFIKSPQSVYLLKKIYIESRIAKDMNCTFCIVLFTSSLYNTIGIFISMLQYLLCKSNCSENELYYMIWMPEYRKRTYVSI